MDVIKSKYITVYLTKKEVDTLKAAKKITQAFLNALDEKEIFYQDYIYGLCEKYYPDEDDINDILLQGNNVPVDPN